jgi:hypothetical protein
MTENGAKSEKKAARNININIIGVYIFRRFELFWAGDKSGCFCFQKSIVGQQSDFLILIP